jgi:uncharacterized RDD family membrane protein YckC
VAWALFGVLGLGAAVLAFLTAWRREHPKVEKPARVPLAVPEPEPPVAPAGTGGYAYAAPGFGAGPASFAGPVADAWQPAPEPAPAPSASELALFPRAAFLDRAAAFAIDVVLVVFVLRLLHPLWFLRYHDDFVLLALLAYFIGFWAWKGTTIGGIVTNLRVAKINGGDLSFLEALVRGLTSILSFGALGIGVLWILRSDVLATDGRPARQAWHDLAAGTYVVKVPKGYPLP